MKSLPELRHCGGGVHHAVRKAPFIVVPTDDANQLALEHSGFEAVDGRAGRTVIEVDRDQRLIGVDENALETAALAGSLERTIDLFEGGIALWREGEVDEAHVRHRNTDSRAVELALQLR